MDTQTIDQEYQKLQEEFQDVAATVKTLADKLQAASTGGDANATAWLADLKQIAQDIDDEQTQAKVLLLAIHSFISGAAQGDGGDKPRLYAPGQEPQQQPAQQQPMYRQGGMFGGGMMGGYMGGGFARSMEMGMGMSLGANLIGNLFRI